MKNVIVLYIVSLLLFSCKRVCAQEDADHFNPYSYIPWSKNWKLTFDDFKDTSYKKEYSESLFALPQSEPLASYMKIFESIYLQKHTPQKHIIIREFLQKIPNCCNSPGEVSFIYDDTMYVDGDLYTRIEHISDSFDKADPPPPMGVSSLTITQEYSVSKDKKEIGFDVIAKFYPEASHLKFRHIDLLDHEQIHFDLCELHARKLRKYILDSCTHLDKIDSLGVWYKKVMEEFEEKNSDFDNETLREEAAHNSVRQTILKWRKRVSEELEFYKNYSNFQISVYLN